MPYEHLAPHYDALMRNLDYGGYADYLLRLAGGSEDDRRPRRVLDLACGTGRLAEALCERGCDVVAVDNSVEMLSVAQGRGCGALFLHQDIVELDLYGTVEAAFCTLDALNYLETPKQFCKTLERVRLFLEPGGVFVFDLLTPDALAARNGAVFMADAEDVYCVWHCLWHSPLIRQDITLFAREDGGLWRRYDEVHTERAYELDYAEEALKEAGFQTVRRYGMMEGKPPDQGDERVVFWAK
ncbi:MAG: class I SAM-dependent methyltransferase [Oscillospiraceae bacterium]|nr:class I SAM-dependent methyltransferase [Oscillospiraceae bacterium]